MSAPPIAVEDLTRDELLELIQNGAQRAGPPSPVDLWKARWRVANRAELAAMEAEGQAADAWLDGALDTIGHALPIDHTVPQDDPVRRLHEAHIAADKAWRAAKAHARATWDALQAWHTQIEEQTR